MSPPARQTSSIADAATTDGINPRRWKILSVLIVCLLVVILDNTVLNVALKTIQLDLGATQDQIIWAINSYSLVFAALLFTWGVLGDRFGRKKTLMTGLVLFGLASALCAFASSPQQLIGFRALMSVGAASVLPITLSIITVTFPPQERGKAIGIWAAAVGGAVALGPIVGGLLLEHPQVLNWLTGNDWGAVFFINVPIIFLGLIGIAMIVPESRNPNPARLDPQGLVLSIVGIFLLVYGIQEGDWGTWSTYAWIGAGLTILAAFIWYESRTDHPSLDLSLFRIRSFSVPLGAVSLTFAAFQGAVLFLIFYYQLVRGWSPLQSGFLVLPVAIGQVLAAPRSGKAVARFGARRVILAGLIIAALGILGMATLPIDAPVWYLIIIGFLFGFGLGNTIAPATTRMTLATPPERSGAGSAVQNTVRQIAAALGVAIISSVLGSVYSRTITPQLQASPLPADLQAIASDSIGATYEVGGNLVAAGRASPAQVQQLFDAANTSFMPAFHTAATLSLGLMVLAMLLVWLRLPAKAEAVAWAGTHATPDVPAEEQIHEVAEDEVALSHVADDK